MVGRFLRAARRPRCACVALTALAATVALCAASSATAAITKSDSAATHAYLQAKLALMKGEAQTGTSSLKALEALAARLRGECPQILAGTPLADQNSQRNAATDDLSQELIGAMFAPGENAGHALSARFYRSVRHLRWSNRKLTKLLRSLALEADLETGLQAPNLCADIRFWVTSGYTQASAATTLYVHEVERISSTATIEFHPNEGPVTGSEDVVAKRLKPYEDPADRRLARRVFEASTKPTPAEEMRVIAAFEQFRSALGLPTPPEG